MIRSVKAGADWKPRYECALLETEVSKQCEHIIAARTAILDRMEDTLCNPDPLEHRAMNEALRNLRRLTEVRMAKTAA